jgi:hypothetical protein
MLIKRMIEGSHRNAAKDSDCKKIRHRRNRIIDSGSNADLMCWYRIDHRGRKGRDADDHAKSKDHDRNENTDHQLNQCLSPY